MNKRKIVNVVAEVLKYAILIAGAIFTLLPFLWMILSSLKTSAEITAIPPSLFPKVPQFSNFAEAWKSAPFPRYIFNTLVVTIISTAGVLVTTVLAAYAFARLNFLGKKIMLSLMLATLMIPRRNVNYYKLHYHHEVKMDQYLSGNDRSVFSECILYLPADTVLFAGTRCTLSGCKG